MRLRSMRLDASQAAASCGAPPPGPCIAHVDMERTGGALLLPSSLKPACAAVAMPAHPTKV